MNCCLRTCSARPGRGSASGYVVRTVPPPWGGAVADESAEEGPAPAELRYARSSRGGTGMGRLMTENGLRDDQAALDGRALRGARVASDEQNYTRNLDEEALALLAATNRATIEQSRLAAERATRESVRWFAEASVTRRTRAMERAGELGRRLRMAPRVNERSERVAEDAVRTQQRLWGLRGRTFERAYVQAQVAQQTRMLELIDGALASEVRDPALREVLEREVRPMVATELELARALQRDRGR